MTGLIITRQMNISGKVVSDDTSNKNLPVALPNLDPHTFMIPHYMPDINDQFKELNPIPL
jgi:hypothetical protein